LEGYLEVVELKVLDPEPVYLEVVSLVAVNPDAVNIKTGNQ